MTPQHHVATNRLVLDDALQARVAAATSPPDHNGCMFYAEGKRAWAKHVSVVTDEGVVIAVSVLRVVYALATGQAVGAGEEVAHCACRNDGIRGPICVAPDHLEKIPIVEHLRKLRRGLARARLARTFRSTNVFPRSPA